MERIFIILGNFQNVNLEFRGRVMKLKISCLHMCLLVVTDAILENVPQGKKQVFAPVKRNVNQLSSSLIN